SLRSTLAEAATRQNFKATAGALDTPGLIAFHTSPKAPTPSNSTSSQSMLANGMSPGLKRGKHVGKNGSKSSGLASGSAAGTVVPSGSAGRRNEWRIVSGT